MPYRDPEAKRRNDAWYNRTERGRALQKARMTRFLATNRGRELYNAGLARYRERNPEKVKARALVNRAIAAGRMLRQPCEVCGAVEVEAHHDDYSKPLDVRWLCQDHHREIK